MPFPPRTPVLVAAGAVEQRLDDPRDALEPVALMLEALERGAGATGCRSLLQRADSVRVTRGFWEYSDPGRIIAERLGATSSRTHLAEIGVLQTTLIGEAAQAIAEGAEEVALVCGGEAKYRSLREQITGVAAPFTPQSGVAPDRLLRPEREIWNALEEKLGVIMPVTQYAMIETALRHAQGLDIVEHRRQIADLWAGFSRVAAGNPHAWSRAPLGADVIAAAGKANRMMAFPYAKLHNSQWNVDQAAGLILCSADVARAAGVPENRWVFPLAVAESNHMLPLSSRADLHRSPGFRIAGERALAIAGIGLHDVDHFELYSCFPVAVRVQARELGLPPDRPLTITGGMAFAGGPLNNFVLQAVARAVEVLRERPATCMVTAVSGMLTKQGVSLWSSRPPAAPFHFADVTAEAARETRVLDVVDDYSGPGRIATYTVIYAGESAVRAVVLCDLPDQRRTLAATDDAGVAAAMTREEHCGREVQIAEQQLSI